MARGIPCHFLRCHRRFLRFQRRFAGTWFIGLWVAAAWAARIRGSMDWSMPRTQAELVKD